MNTTTKIINIVTSNNGKTYQRTTKRNRFTCATIITYPNGKGIARFHETEAEAIAHKETYISNFERNQAYLAPHDRNTLADMLIEIVPVVQQAI